MVSALTAQYAVKADMIRMVSELCMTWMNKSDTVPPDHTLHRCRSPSLAETPRFQGSGCRRGNSPDWPTTRPRGSCASQGGALPRFWSPP